MDEEVPVLDPVEEVDDELDPLVPLLLLEVAELSLDPLVDPLVVLLGPEEATDPWRESVR